jgi:hypothetical protein
MKDFQVSEYNIDVFFEELLLELKENKLLICSSQPANTGKWGLARLWRAWMATTAKFMTGNGARMPLMTKDDGTWYGSRPFNSDDAHELFTRQWLGVDENGERLSWAKSGEQRKATKGERFNALRQHENWCVEKGITLFKPRESEYVQLQNEQDT